MEHVILALLIGWFGVCSVLTVAVMTAHRRRARVAARAAAQMATMPQRTLDEVAPVTGTTSA